MTTVCTNWLNYTVENSRHVCLFMHWLYNCFSVTFPTHEIPYLRSVKVLKDTSSYNVTVAFQNLLCIL